MQRMLLLLGILAAFTFMAVAQDASQTSGTQSTTTTSKKKSSKSDMSGMAMDHQGSKGAKGSTLTGCLSSSANAEGMYTLSNAKMKKGVEVGPTDKVKDHAGHQVALTGKWSTGAEAGEKAGTKEEKGERHFEVDSVKHISETCSEAPGGGTTGSKTKGKSKGTGEASSTPKGF